MTAGEGSLEIMLVEARDLKDDITDKCCFLGGCLNLVKPCKRAKKPYAHIVYGNQEHTSSVAERNKRTWKWNDKFVFDAKYPADAAGEEQNHAYKIIIRLMDRHKYSDDCFIGQTTIYVKDIVSLGVEKGKMEVEATKYRVAESDKTYSGEISVAISFIKAREGITQEIGTETSDGA